MTLQEILDAVLEKYPHSFDSTNIIKKINTIQKELFRTLYKPVTATTYDILADNAFYPIEYSPQTIIDVVVNGCEYEQVNINGSGMCRYWYITDDNCIGIYPTPTEDSSAGLTVFRFKEPTTLTISDLGVEPDFDRAWHMMLVYRVCKDLAESENRDDMANLFVSQFNALESEYNRSKVWEPFQIEDVFRGYML